MDVDEGPTAVATQVDEVTTRFFGRDAAEGANPDRPPNPPGAVDDPFDTFSTGYDPGEGLEAIDDFDREPTPALLAAKAEPLGGVTNRRTNKKSDRSPRPSKAAEAARASKTRARSRRKPKEPSKLLLGLAIGLVLLAGFGAAYLLTRSSDDNTTATDDLVPTDEVTTETTTEAPADGATTTIAPESPATGLTPVVVFDEAAVGPIMSDTPYTIAVGDGPANANYRLLVDDAPQADPAPELPPVVFTPGRHLLVIEIFSPEGDITTNPVVVYAVGAIPQGASYRANLSSVNIDPDIEGWATAVRQFDDFTAAGHTDLQLMPSDWFPSLTPGYWNIFVGGFEDSATAVAYCEQYGLVVPDQCFPQLFDPDAPASG